MLKYVQELLLFLHFSVLTFAIYNDSMTLSIT